jgi:hypothetical protein
MTTRGPMPRRWIPPLIALFALLALAVLGVQGAVHQHLPE